MDQSIIFLINEFNLVLFLYYQKINRDFISGEVGYNGIRTNGNQGFIKNQIIRLEFDSFKGTLIFFLDGVQQPVYISGIKEKVRFIV